MQQYENPFSMRASEKVIFDDAFISLFSEESLYSFKDLSEYAKTLGFELSAYLSQEKEKLSKDDNLPLLAHNRWHDIPC